MDPNSDTSSPSEIHSPSASISSNVSLAFYTASLAPEVLVTDDGDSSSMTIESTTDRQPINLPHNPRASQGGCWTCRLRRKACDEQRKGDSCNTCLRLGINCLGWGPKRPEWMQDKQAVEAYKADIKAQLTRTGLIRGQPRSSLLHKNPTPMLPSQNLPLAYPRASAPDITSLSPVHPDPYGSLDMGMPPKYFQVPESWASQLAEDKSDLWESPPTPTLTFPDNSNRFPEITKTHTKHEYLDPTRSLAHLVSQSTIEDVDQKQGMQEENLRDNHVFSLGAHGLRSNHSITADLAFAHASSKEIEICDALRRCQYDGYYLIQVGFNTELMHMGRYEEEIYIFLEHVVFPEIGTALSMILAPFPGILYTPGLSTPIDPMIPSSEPKDLLYTLRSHSGTSPANSGKSVPQTGPGNRSSGNQGGEGSDPRRDKGKDVDKSGGHGPPGDNGDPDGLPDGNGDPDGPKSGPKGPCLISIPFRSTLFTRESQDEPSIKFVTTSHIDIKIEKNIKGDPAFSPPGPSWFGPWFEVDMKKLDMVFMGGAHFNLGSTQVLMTVLRCSGANSINKRPTTTHFDDGGAKMKSERTNAGSLAATIGANPTLRIGGTISSVTGNEQTQKRWKTTACPLDSGGGTFGEYKDGMLWIYTYNDKVFEPISAHDFHDVSPSTVFHLRPASVFPELEVEVVTHWETQPITPQLLHLFSLFRKGTKKPLPAYRNFLHHVSVGVDIGKVKYKTSSVSSATSMDEWMPSDTSYDPIKALADSYEAIDSECEITLKRAIYGYIKPITADDSKGRWPLLPNPERTVRTSPLPGGLPTPSPSPVPSSSQLPQPRYT